MDAKICMRHSVHVAVTNGSSEHRTLFQLSLVVMCEADESEGNVQLNREWCVPISALRPASEESKQVNGDQAIDDLMHEQHSKNTCSAELQESGSD